MSIYATLWQLKFPAAGDEFPGCEWLGVGTARAYWPQCGHLNAPHMPQDTQPFCSRAATPLTQGARPM